MNNLKIGILLSTIFITGCTTTSQFSQDSDVSLPSHPIEIDLEESFKNLSFIFNSPHFSLSLAACEDVETWAKQLEAQKFTSSSLDSKAIFNVRLALREKFQSHYRDQISSGAQTALPKCVEAMKYSQKVFRQIEDQLILSQNDETSPIPTFNFNPRYGAVEKNQFQQGDVIVSGGGAATTWMISKAVDEQGSMSSIGMIYGSTQGNSNSGVMVIEANIETGITAIPLDEYLKENKGRFSLYRFTDPTRLNWAHTGAQKLYSHITEKNEKALCFDRKFLPEDFTCLTPVKVITKAFLLGSENEFITPLFLNEFDDSLSTLQKKLGVESQRAAVISDFELDFRFDLVKEWRVPSQLANLRRVESTFKTINKWLETRYTSVPGSVQAIRLRPILSNRTIPLFSERLKDKFPSTFEPQLTSWFVPTVDAAEYMTRKLADAEKELGLLSAQEQMQTLEMLMKREELNSRGPATQKTPLTEAFRRLK